MTVNELHIKAGPTSVLILEDLEETLAWLRDIVSETFPGAEITSTSTLMEASQQVDQSTYDLVMVDLGLPDGSGLDLIKQIRASSQDTYIVVATIYDDDEHLVNALRNGANGYLLKDEHRDRLIEHLKGIPASRAPMSDRTLNRVINQFTDNRSDVIALTSRDEEVLQLVAKGYNVSESADTGAFCQYSKKLLEGGLRKTGDFLQSRSDGRGNQAPADRSLNRQQAINR